MTPTSIGGTLKQNKTKCKGQKSCRAPSAFICCCAEEDRCARRGPCPSATLFITSVTWVFLVSDPVRPVVKPTHSRLRCDTSILRSECCPCLVHCSFKVPWPLDVWLATEKYPDRVRTDLSGMTLPRTHCGHSHHLVALSYSTFLRLGTRMYL